MTSKNKYKLHKKETSKISSYTRDLFVSAIKEDEPIEVNNITNSKLEKSIKLSKEIDENKEIKIGRSK